MEATSIIASRDEQPVVIPVGQMSVLEDLIRQLDEIVRSARSMPLSSSALIDRQKTLEVIEMLARSIPEEVARARAIIRDRDDVLARAEGQSARVIEKAQAQRDRLVSQTEIFQSATREAERLIQEAEATGARIRAEAERYVEGKLATFEVVLQRTLAAVERGRARMAGAMEADALAGGDLDDQDAPFSD